MNTRVALLGLLLLTGCATTVAPVKTCEPIPMIDPPFPGPVVLSAPEFYVVSNENRKDFDLKITDGVFYAVTPAGYTILATNMQELRRYIRELQQVVLYYKRYDENISSTKSESNGNNGGK
jgi:hypothetical protein